MGGGGGQTLDEARLAYIVTSLHGIYSLTRCNLLLFIYFMEKSYLFHGKNMFCHSVYWCVDNWQFFQHHDNGPWQVYKSFLSVHFKCNCLLYVCVPRCWVNMQALAVLSRQVFPLQLSSLRPHVCPDVGSIWQVLAVLYCSFEMYIYLRTALEYSTIIHLYHSGHAEVNPSTDDQTI